MHDFNPSTCPFSWKHVLVAWVLALLLLISWQVPLTHAWWDACDQWVYLHLHHTLVLFPKSRAFWAMFNSRMGDWLLEGAVCLIAFYELIRGRSSRFWWLWLGFVVIFLTHILWHNVKDLMAVEWIRLSPSYIYGIEEDLSRWTHWPNSKVWSSRSFPGDHAISLWMIAIWFYYIARPYFWPILTLVLLAALPRLIAGAHWFSDLIIGAGIWTLLVIPLVLRILLWIRTECRCDHSVLDAK